MTKIALLVGCNYSNSTHEDWPELRGTHNDVNAMSETLIHVYSFDPDNIEVLTDNPGKPDQEMPTGDNIKSALGQLISELQEGDVLYFHFSGHGTRFPFRGRLVEAIVPCDGNFITNMDFRELVDCVPKHASFVFFSDSCHSGGLIDKEKEQIGPNTSLHNGTIQLRQNGAIQSDNYNYKSRFVPYETVVAALQETLPTLRGLNNVPNNDVETIMLRVFGSDASLLFRPTRNRLPEPLKPDRGILLSACQSDEYASECYGVHFGAFTYAVQFIIREKLLPQPITLKQLVMKAREIIPRILKSSRNLGPKQHPCLYCSDVNVDRNFLSDSESESLLQLRQDLQRRRELHQRLVRQNQQERQNQREPEPRRKTGCVIS